MADNKQQYGYHVNKISLSPVGHKYKQEINIMLNNDRACARSLSQDGYSIQLQIERQF